MSAQASLPCLPQGRLSPWVDDRPRTCTLCAEFVDVRALPDGSDWYAVDATGSPCGTDVVPELCACYPIGDPLRTRSGKIVNVGRGPDIEIDEKSRHYGAGLWLTEWRGNSHMHDATGGQEFYSSISSLPLACGHRLPPVRRTRPIVPLSTDRLPPECHGRPMRWAPRGWQCRAAGTYFTPRV